MTRVLLVTYDSWLARIRRGHGTAIVALTPHHTQRLSYKLDVGAEWVGYGQQNADLDALIATGNLWCLVYYSSSGRPVCKRVQRQD